MYYKYLHTGHMVTFQMLRLYTLILTITIKDSFLWENKMILNIKNTAGRVKVKIIWIVHLKNDFFGKTWTPKKFVKNPRKHLLRLASDSQKKNNVFFIGRFPVPLPFP